MLRGSHFIKSWAATQKNVALSFGEAELVAAARMSTELIGLCQLCHEIQMLAFGMVHVDSAALGVFRGEASEG